MKDEQWDQITRSEYDRERAALELLRARLPDYAPFRAWASFQFFSLDGAFLDVDALVFSEAGVFLIELATQRGALEIGPRTWRHTKQNGRTEVFDSPLGVARLKAEKLYDLLEHSTPSSFHVPPIQPVVFLSEDDVEVDVDADATTAVFFHPQREKLPSIVAALVEGRGPGVHPMSNPLTRLVLKRFEEVAEEVGFDATDKYRKVGDFVLGELLDTTDAYQDYVARHPRTGELRRARVFHARKNAGDEQLARLQEAARREHKIVSGLTHDGILKALKHIGHEARPAVLFEHPQGAVRLDHYMEQSEGLPAAARFKLLEQICDAVRYAHQNRVVHRALSPQCVLVLPPDEDQPSKGQPARGEGVPRIKILNWHTSTQEDRETGTRHVENYLHDTSRLFLAPEVTHSPHVDESADVFGLGAIAYYLFTGTAPGHDLQSKTQLLAEQRGLRLTTVRDAVSPALDDLVYNATRVRPNDRLVSVDAFLNELAQAQRSLIAVGRSGVADPLEATPGMFIGSYEVIRRLGSGSTATALLVEADDRRYVLKIANDDAHASRLEAEAEALAKLDHPLIVDIIDRIEAGGRTILVLEDAGTTFRERLRETSALSLDELRRYGDDLCEILQALEDQRVFHRDIKPSNLGLLRPEKTRPRLMLFDFSLAGVGIEQTEVGTNAYRDPFVTLRRRWDAYSDRYSAALVLYEMVTQQLPRWGDGRISPDVDLEAELHLQAERFPASVRDGLRAFFEEALARNIEDRFDNAAEMAQSWLDVFERTMHTDHGEESLDDKLHRAQPSTRLATLGISQLAVDALDSLDVIYVNDLLALPANKLMFLSGVSQPVRDELTNLRRKLADLFPTLDYARDQAEEDVEPEDFALKSVDHLLEYIHGSRTDEKADLRDLIADVLTGGDISRTLQWPSHAEIAKRIDVPSAEIDALFDEMRISWRKKKSLLALRDDTVRLVTTAGGAMTTAELTRAVLGERGSFKSSTEDRLNVASAVTRAAVEGELSADNPRVRIMRLGDETFIATQPALLDVLAGLGTCADELATEDPLASPERAYEALLEVLECAGLDPIPRHRALALGAAASQGAAVSQRDEIYPVGMSARRALTLTANVLLRQNELTDEQLCETVRNRYPQAEPLPKHPELDDLLKEVDIALTWNTKLNGGRGGYVYENPFPEGPGLSRDTRTFSIFASSTTYQTAADVDRQIDRFLDRLGYKSRNGGFLALMVAPRQAMAAPQKLAETHNLDVVSLEEIILRHLHEQSDAKNIQWPAILEADAPTAGDQARRYFGQLLRHHVIPAVREELVSLRGRKLITHPGLLARWNEFADTMSLLDDLRDAAAQPDGPEAVWLLVASDSRRTRPHIDGEAVPVTDDSEYVRIPTRWLTGAKKVPLDSSQQGKEGALL